MSNRFKLENSPSCMVDKYMNRKNQGYTLIEFLIASALSIFLLTILWEIFLSVKSVFQLTQAFSQMQEEGRFANYFLVNNIRMAGDLRCINGTKITSPNAIQAYSSDNLPNYLKNNRIPHNSDILVIERCVALNQINQPAKIAFFIAATNQKDFAGHIVYGLYEKIMANKIVKTMEIIPHAENMHIQYGILDKTYKNIANYVTAAQITSVDWKNIGSVTVLLSLVSATNVFTQPQSDHDQRMHRRWNIYIALRENSRA